MAILGRAVFNSISGETNNSPIRFNKLDVENLCQCSQFMRLSPSRVKRLTSYLTTKDGYCLQTGLFFHGGDTPVRFDKENRMLIWNKKDMLFLWSHSCSPTMDDDLGIMN